MNSKIILSIDESKKQELKDYCKSQGTKTSMTSLVGGLINKFMSSKKFTSSVKKPTPKKSVTKKKVTPKTTKKVKKVSKKKKVATKKKK